MNTVERAREIRKELKAKFKGVKFSVRTKKYSGGSSISVSWVDFPTVEAVEEITSKYESVRYDEYTGEILSGGNTYIHTYNTWSEEMEANIKENLILKYGIEFYNEYINGTYDFYRYAREIFQDMYNKSLTIESEVKEEPKTEDKKILFSNNDIQVAEVGKTTRIYFNGKPSEEIRNSIKALGFRFFKNDGFYWGIYSNKTTLEAIKEALQVEDVEQVDDLETIIQHEQEYINQVLKEELKEFEPLEVAEAKEEIKINNVTVGRKENNIYDIEEYGTKEKIIITKYAILNNNDFDYICNNLLNDFNFLEGFGGSRAEAKEGAEVPQDYDINYIYNNKDKFNFYEINILITNEDKTRFIVVNPHGYNYCRYVGILTAAEGRRILKQLKGEPKENKFEVLEGITEATEAKEEQNNVQKINNIYAEVEALENRLKLVKSNKLKYKLQDQINLKMKEIAKIILSDELLYLQFMKESKE